jgi:hypothetical protein
MYGGTPEALYRIDSTRRPLQHRDPVRHPISRRASGAHRRLTVVLFALAAGLLLAAPAFARPVMPGGPATSSAASGGLAARGGAFSAPSLVLAGVVLVAIGVSVAVAVTRSAKLRRSLRLARA